MRDLFIVSQEVFDRIPDRKKLHRISTLHGSSSRKNFFMCRFNNVRCTLSKDDAVRLGVNQLRADGSFAYVSKIGRIEKGDYICYALDNYTLDVWTATDLIIVEFLLFHPEKITEIPVIEFGEALKTLCEDIDKNRIREGIGNFLPPLNCKKNSSIPESYKTVWLGINSYFKKTDGTIDREQINKVIDGLPEYNIRVYPTECSRYGWIAAAFEFRYRDKVYKIAF